MLIQFKDAKTANDLIKRGRVTIPIATMTNYEFEVRTVYEMTCNDDGIAEKMEKLNLEKDNMESIQTPTENSPDNIIHALCDDALSLIFEKIDNWTDLISIANVCKRFRRIVEETYRYEGQRKDVTLDGNAILTQFEDFLRVFGPSIRSVKFICKDLSITAEESNTVLKMINKFCGNLKDLELNAVSGITSQTLIEIRPLLSKLISFWVFLPADRDFGPFIDFVSACTKLKSLYVFGHFDFSSHGITTFPAICLPNLTTFWLTFTLSIEQFLILNPQIEILSVKYSLGLGRMIATHLTNVRRVTFAAVENECSESDNIYFNQVKYLESHVLTRSIDTFQSIYSLSNITTLNIHLGLSHDEDEFTKLTRKLNKLEVLNLISMHPVLNVTTDVIKKMLQNDSQIQTLSVKNARNTFCQFNEKDYYEILESIKRRTNRTKLTIHFVSYTDLIDPSNDGFGGERIKIVNFNAVPDLLIVRVITANRYVDYV